MFKFSQKEVTAKDFYGQTQITDIFTLDVNKLVLSDKVPCNNGKDCRYIAGYQVDEVLIPLFIKTPKNFFSYGVSQYDRNSAYIMTFNVSEEKEWMPQYKKIWNEVGSKLFEKLAREPIKGNNVHGKLKTWKKDIKANFHNQTVPCDVHCNATAVLKIDSVYEQSKNYHSQTYIEECIYIDVEKQKCNMLGDDDYDGEGFFEI